MQVAVNPGLEHGDAAEPVELGGVRVVVEGAGDEDVDARVARLARGGDEVRARDRAELGADEDGRAPLGARGRAALEVTAFGADDVPGSRHQRGEDEWFNAPAHPQRQVGWVIPEDTPDYARPVRRLAVRWGKRNRQIGHELLISTPTPAEVMGLLGRSSGGRV